MSVVPEVVVISVKELFELKTMLPVAMPESENVEPLMVSDVRPQVPTADWLVVVLVLLLPLGF